MTTTDHDLPSDDIEFVPDQIARAAARRDTVTDRRQRRADAMRPLLWRLHFLGGFLAGPVVVMLCISGILYAWNPQIDDLRYGSIMNASSSEVNVTLADQVAAAQEAHPEWDVHSVVPGSGGENTVVMMDPPGGEEAFGSPSDGVSVYVDQASGEVTGELTGDDFSGEWLSSLHSSFRLGPTAEPVTELAGSWFLVSMLTGLYLWWPGLRKRGAVAFAARRGLQGRRKSKEWHNFIGVSLFVPMFFLAVTGLTWTNYAGSRVDIVKEQLAVPSSGADTVLPAPAAGNTDLANLDTVYAAVGEADMEEPVQIVLPGDDETGWKVASNDTVFPLERDQMVVDGTTGEVTSYIDYEDEHWFNKLRSAGIYFHQAQLFGVPLQIFMSVLALAIAAMVIFGYQMWWQRRPANGMGAPPPVRDWARNLPIPVLLAGIVLAWFMPLLAVALVVWLVVEAGWRWTRQLRDGPPSRGNPTPDDATTGSAR